MIFFFFKQKTAYEIKECDWSSDVCSSDLFSLNLTNRISEASTVKFKFYSKQQGNLIITLDDIDKRAAGKFVAYLSKREAQ